MPHQPEDDRQGLALAGCGDKNSSEVDIPGALEATYTTIVDAEDVATFWAEFSAERAAPTRSVAAGAWTSSFTMVVLAADLATVYRNAGDTGGTANVQIRVERRLRAAVVVGPAPYASVTVAPVRGLAALQLQFTP